MIGEKVADMVKATWGKHRWFRPTEPIICIPSCDPIWSCQKPSSSSDSSVSSNGGQKWENGGGCLSLKLLKNKCVFTSVVNRVLVEPEGSSPLNGRIPLCLRGGWTWRPLAGAGFPSCLGSSFASSLLRGAFFFPSRVWVSFYRGRGLKGPEVLHGR